MLLPLFVKQDAKSGIGIVFLLPPSRRGARIDPVPFPQDPVPLELIRAPYVLYGVTHIDPVSPARFSDPVPPQYNPFEIGLEFLWFNQAWDPHVMDYYNTSIYQGPSTVAGQACGVWEWSVGTCTATECDQIHWCVTEDGGLLGLNRSQVVANPSKPSQIYNTQLRHTFAEYSPKVNMASFAVPKKGCADMRPIDAADSSLRTRTQLDDSSTLINNAARIDAINRAAAGAWYAAPSRVWEGLTLEDAQLRLGLARPIHHITRAPHTRRHGARGSEMKPLSALKLALPSAEHQRQRAALAVPASFDLRKKFPACLSVNSIRNQGDCGSCWAFAGVESLADRFCTNSKSLENISLSPEYLMDCDALNAGCGGGMIDDAWKFLEGTGVADEACDPYVYCAHPVSPSCEVGPHPVRPAPHQIACPAQCKSGGVPKKYKTSSAYAVAHPGDVESMQQEIMAYANFVPRYPLLYYHISVI